MEALSTIDIKTERNGRLLCSPRNPLKEAKDWISRQKISAEDRTALIIGFGAGFHARELRDQFPSLNIHVLELDQAIHASDFNFVQNPKPDDYELILAFRPAWAGFESEYLQSFVHLTGRDINPEKYFSNNEEDLKIWYCLRELVK